MAYKARRQVHVSSGPGSLRARLCEYLRYAKIKFEPDLANLWGIHPNSVFRLMRRGRPLAPEYVEAVITKLQLDEFDANELRLLGAREMGWKIDPKFLLRDE